MGEGELVEAKPNSGNMKLKDPSKTYVQRNFDEMRLREIIAFFLLKKCLVIAEIAVIRHFLLYLCGADVST